MIMSYPIIIFNRLKGKVEEVLTEEQTEFRSGLITVKQSFNCRIIIVTPETLTRSLPQLITTAQNAFEHTRHDDLCQVLKGFNIDKVLLQGIQ